MPAKKEPALTDEERARRIRDLAAEAGTSNDPSTFDRAFAKVVRGQPENPSNHGPRPKAR